MNRGNIKVAGNADILPGEYESIRIMGNAKSVGDVTAEKMIVMGAADFKGNLQLGTVSVHGDAVIRGNVKAESLKVNGKLIVEGNCEVNHLTVNGDFRVSCEVQCNTVTVKGDFILQQKLVAKDVNVLGDLRTTTDIECDDIKVLGRIQCDGLLNAENVNLYPKGNSYCKEIGASNIKMLRNHNNPVVNLFFKNSFGQIECDVVEGDFIEIESAKIRELRGKQIDLVNYCTIEQVEYQDSLIVSENSTVRECKQVS